MIEEITTTIDAIQGIGFVGLLIILAIPALRKKVFNGNGEYKDLEDKISSLQDNHLHDLSNKIDELMKEERQGNDIVKETNIKLQALIDSQKK